MFVSLSKAIYEKVAVLKFMQRRSINDIKVELFNRRFLHNEPNVYSNEFYFHISITQLYSSTLFMHVVHVVFALFTYDIKKKNVKRVTIQMENDIMHVYLQIRLHLVKQSVYSTYTAWHNARCDLSDEQ